jgi:hypothetical protein
MSQSNTIRTENTGKSYIRGRDDIERLVNPDLIKKTTISTARRPTTLKKNQFKLVTVRRLTKYTLEQVNKKLADSQKNLESAALRQGSPIPYPSPAPTTDKLAQYYGIFVDEDLYGTDIPVYTFYSPSSNIRCFITANGDGKEDWSIHVCHVVDEITNADKTVRTKWRLYTLDNRLGTLASPVSYVLDSNDLPPCFEHQFDISSIVYLGGGCWASLAIEPTDRIPIYAPAPNNGRYISVGQPFRAYGETRSMSLVAYSCTPTYSFTWCRGKLEKNHRERSAEINFQEPEYIGTRVIRVTRTHDYKLDLVERPEIKNALYNLERVTKQEYVTGTANYVGNTNRTVCSTYQCPDYNTDSARLSIANYTSETNIIRPTYEEDTYDLTANKVSYQAPGFIPIMCADPSMGHYIRVNFGVAKGSITHGYEVKSTGGSRAYSYFEPYKYWWGYGQVLAVYAYGDTKRYHRAKSTGLRSEVGSMFDYGELKQDPEWANRVLTTWDAPPFPETGFFGTTEGRLSFIVQYLNPPLTGHDGVYYYHLNPPRVGIGSTSADREFDSSIAATGAAAEGAFVGGEAGADSTAQGRQNELLFAYSQLAGALGGGGLTSLNIGMITVAGNDKESIVVRDPNPYQKAALEEAPETFPSGFWDADKFSVTLNNTNNGTFTAYDENGDASVVTSF